MFLSTESTEFFFKGLFSHLLKGDIAIATKAESCRFN